MGKGKFDEVMKDLPTEERKAWAAQLKELERGERNNERKHKSHRDGIDIHRGTGSGGGRTIPKGQAAKAKLS